MKINIFSSRSEYKELGRIPANSMVKDDCLVAMKYIRPHSVDMILCDLPYEVTSNAWDTIIPFDKLWAKYNKVLKPDGVVVLTAIQPFTSLTVMSNKENYKHRWFWNKGNGTNFLQADYQPLRTLEDVLVFCRTSKYTYNPQMRLGHKAYKTGHGSGSANYGGAHNEDVVIQSDGDRYPIDVLSYPPDKNKIHPTQKPIALFSYLIRTYTDEGQLVLDNTAGSGTTAIACMQTGRRFIVMEKGKKEYRDMKKRILNPKSKLTPKQQKQKDMVNDNEKVRNALSSSLFSEEEILSTVKKSTRKRKKK